MVNYGLKSVGRSANDFGLSTYYAQKDAFHLEVEHITTLSRFEASQPTLPTLQHIVYIEKTKQPGLPKLTAESKDNYFIVHTTTG